MSKQKTAKTLIIEEDEVQEDGDELNPFSFKEFIRTKNKGPETHTEPDNNKYYPTRKTYGSSLATDRDYPPQRHPDAGQRLLGAEPWLSPGASPGGAELEEEEWSGSYEPAALEEESQEFSSTYSGPSSLGAEDDASWREQGEEPSLLGEEPSLLGEELVWQAETQRGPVDYEGDDETSMVELAYRSPNGRPEPRKTHLQRLQDENMQLRRNVKALLKKADNDDRRLRELTDELHKRRLQEEREAQALETMVHSVEQNLHLMTKRAVKAENNVTKLKQEFHNLQSQMESYRCENDRLRAGETAAMNTMKQNAQVASKYLNKAALNAETSIKQLLTGAETLCLVSQLLHSIDKIGEFQGEG